jgi:phospholipid/cholesterol/gamma-HCH transport system substrate-binding protein
MPDAFWGFTIGKVSSLELNDQGIVLIQIKIPERHIRMIRANSKFILDKPLIGIPRIVVQTSDLGDRPLSPQAVPELTESNDINEIIKRAQPIIEKADRIMANIEGITAKLDDPEGDVNRILRETETLIARFSKRDSLLEIAIGDPESIKAIHESLRKIKEITARVDGILQRIDAMAGKTDEELYGPDGVLPQFRNILRDLLMKLAKIDTTFDNINQVSAEAVDSTKNLKGLRNELDETIMTIRNLADEIDRKIPFKTQPEIKLP